METIHPISFLLCFAYLRWTQAWNQRPRLDFQRNHILSVTLGNDVTLNDCVRVPYRYLGKHVAYDLSESACSVTAGSDLKVHLL